MKLKKPRYKLPGARDLGNLVLAEWRTALIIGGSVAAAAGLMFWRLSRLAPGLSPAELDTYHSAESLGAIGDHMVNAPYKLWLLINTSLFDSVFGLRLAGATVGLGTIILFYLLVKQVLNARVAIITTAMFATSSLLLSVSRQATPNAMLLSLLAIIAAGFYLRFGKRTDWGWLTVVIITSLSLYVPGMLFFIVPAMAWQFRHVRKTFDRLDTRIIVAASIVMGVLCAPLLISLIRDSNLWRGYLGLPEQLAPLSDMAKYAGTAVVSLFARSPHEPTFWLGRQPVLDVFATVMFVYGLYALVKQYKLDRLWTLGGVFVLALLWIGITTNRLGIVLLLPFVYLIVGFGLQRFIDQWLSVFPRNPIARGTGWILLLVAVCIAVNFQAYRYFIAWSNSDTTKAVFTQHYPR